MVLPDISRLVVWSGFGLVYLAHVARSVPLGAGMLPFWRVVVCPVGVAGALFGPLLVAIGLMSVRVLLLRRATVFLLMFVPVLLLGTTVPLFVAMLCIGRGCS
jgi:hypothetical protein